MKKTAIVTGASSGLGIEFVKILTEKNEVDEIWIIARNADALQKLVKNYGSKLKPIPMDLTDRNNIGIIADKINNDNANIIYLINNAGFGRFGSYDDISTNEALNMIDLNAGCVVALCQTCIPHMSSGGHIINIASQASFQPLPYLNVYAATKAFVRNYSRALNVELKDKNISATAVCPGWMRTAFIDRCKTGAKKSVWNFTKMASPDVVARKAIRDAECGKDMSVYSAYVKLLHIAAKILPQRMAMRIWLRQQKF